MLLRNLIALASFTALSGMSPRADAVQWHITPVVESGAVTRLDMSLSFPGDADGVTEVQLPDEWGGERELYRGLWDIRATGGEVDAASPPGKLVLRHAPGAHLRLDWKVGSGPDAPDAKLGGNDYRPRFAPDHFYFIGFTVLPQPDSLSETTAARVTLDRPDGLTLVSDLDHAGPSGRTTFGNLSQSAVFGGNLRLIESGKARLALVGTFDTLDDAFWQQTFTAIASAERRYWSSGDEPFLVTVIAEPLEPGSYSIGGTGLGDAFSLFSGANMQAEDAAPLIAHEMMHTWIPHRIGRMPEEDEARHYWLSEGFTDWATFRVLVREGLWSPADFAKAFNQAAEAFDISPVRTATASDIADGFWSSQEMSRLPYQKGMLIAAWLDAGIRGRTKGKSDLDDVLLRMQRAASRDTDAYAYDLLVREVKKVAGWDVAAELDAMAMQGAPVTLAEDTFAPCGKVTVTAGPIWERGFDFSATAAAGWKIQGVEESSRAYEAGLRNDMELRSWSEDSRDRTPEKEATALVTEGDGVRAITWLPASREDFPVRSLLLADVANDAACARRLSGE